MTILKEGGLPVPGPRKTLDDKLFALIGNEIIYMIDFIPGKHIAEVEQTEELLGELGRYLG